MESPADAGVPGSLARWNEVFAESGDSWFFGREPSDLARQVHRYWRELYGDRAARIVDLGCGEGRDSVYFAQCGHAVTAVDGSEIALAKALRLAQEQGVSVAASEPRDVRDTDLRPGSFDIYYSGNCLQFLGADCLPMLARIQRATSPGGVNAISAFTRETEHLAGRQDIYRFDRNELKFHYRGWRLLQYREEVLWRQPANGYLSFAAVIAVRPEQQG